MFKSVFLLFNINETVLCDCYCFGFKWSAIRTWSVECNDICYAPLKRNFIKKSLSEVSKQNMQFQQLLCRKCELFRLSFCHIHILNQWCVALLCRAVPKSCLWLKVIGSTIAQVNPTTNTDAITIDTTFNIQEMFIKTLSRYELYL